MVAVYAHSERVAEAPALVPKQVAAIGVIRHHVTAVFRRSDSNNHSRVGVGGAVTDLVFTAAV